MKKEVIKKEKTASTKSTISSLRAIFNSENPDDRGYISEAEKFVNTIMLEEVFTGSTASVKDICVERFITIWENRPYLRFTILDMIDTVRTSEEVGLMNDEDFPPITISRIYDAKADKYHDTQFKFVLEKVAEATDTEQARYKWFAVFESYPIDMSDDYRCQHMYMINDAEDAKDLYLAFYRMTDLCPLNLNKIFG